MELNIDYGDRFAEWQSVSAFNTYYQYSFISRSTFYANFNGRYKNYGSRWLQNYAWWYDGWVPYFHNSEQGIFSTKLASSLVNGVAKKIIGGRLAFQTKERQKIEKDENNQYIVNEALSFMSSEWAPQSDFAREIKKAVAFSAALGTSLLKLDKHGKDLCVKAIRFDSGFYPTVGFNGKLIDLICFIRDFTQITETSNGEKAENYVVVEHRYFGDYTDLKTGEVEHNVPLIKYEIKKSTGSITTAQSYEISGESENIEFDSLPRSVKRNIAKTFAGISFKRAMRLPFDDYLGAELINFTDFVTPLPELPFGDSFLYPIMAMLQSYDYYWSCFNTDMYTGRARLIVDRPFQTKEAEQQNYNSGLNDYMYTAIPRNSDGQPMQPLPLQFDLRSQSWAEIRTMILQEIAVHTGLNISTIASFLNDSNGNKTAREISTEESVTAEFVEDKREIIERPINRLLKYITAFYGYSDEIVLRWSATGTTNIYTRSEMIGREYQQGIRSLESAVKELNPDKDEYQIQEEYERIVENQVTQSKSVFDDFNLGDNE